MAKKQKIARTVLVTLRMRPPEAEGLYKIAQHYGLNKSEVVRWLVTREAGRIEGAKGGQNGNL